jgi:membrane protein implicated in regulation of membrane protease activity
MAGDSSVVGQVGELVHATRGADGPGEVKIRIRGGSEIYLAWSEKPLPAGTTVLIIESRGARNVDVVPWSRPFGD